MRKAFYVFAVVAAVSGLVLFGCETKEKKSSYSGNQAYYSDNNVGNFSGNFADQPRRQIFMADISQPINNVQTNATGKATFTLNEDQSAINFRISVSNINDVTVAHLHQGRPDQEGAPVAMLYPGPTKQGTFSGVLAKGQITKSDLIGPLRGKELSELVDLINNGEIFVNVHSLRYPEGEIRGMVQLSTRQDEMRMQDRSSDNAGNYSNMQNNAGNYSNMQNNAGNFSGNYSGNTSNMPSNRPSYEADNYIDAR